MVVTKLPEKQGIIGTREIAKAVREGKVTRVIVAANCPISLRERVGSVAVEEFDGDAKQLGTKLGKPFSVAMVGYA